MPDIKELKSLFDSPKKARITILCALVALITLGAIVVYIVYSLGNAGVDAPPSQSEAASDAPAQSGDPEETVTPTQNLMGVVPTLTIDEARALALKHAGVAEDQADVSREALTEDNGIWVYEFRFRTEQAQYEYLINANTGDVRSMVKETFVYPSAEVTPPPASDSAPPAQTAPQPSTAVSSSSPPQPAQSTAPASSQRPASTPAPTPSPSASLYIGADRAKTIALEHAGLSASEVIFTKSSMDREHGQMVYELEFRQGRVEYEYEIDAASGSILKYEREGTPTGTQSAASAAPVSTPAATKPSAPAYISAEQAKSIALNHAGLSASEVVFDHAHMDMEHGVKVYEIEFRQGRVEYEYEIDAATGQILDYERDMD